MDIYSVDQYGIYRRHLPDMTVVCIVPVIESNIDYQDMQTWRHAGNDLVRIEAEAPAPDLANYKLQAFNTLLETGNKFVKSLTSDLLDCELQSFPTLVEQANAVKRGETGAATRQITVQATMTNKTNDQVADRVLLLAFQMDMVVPVMSSMRQNVGKMIDAATSVEQVDMIVEMSKQQGRSAVADMMEKLKSGTI
jgi:hypothetical protein